MYVVVDDDDNDDGNNDNGVVACNFWTSVEEYSLEGYI